MSSIIERRSLEVGQWIQFNTTADLKFTVSDKQSVYEKNQRFLVISREDTHLDNCRCYVISIDGRIYDYSATRFLLGDIDLEWNSEI